MLRLALVATIVFQGAVNAVPGLASSYAGSTSTAAFPPPGATGDSNAFPNGAQVGYAGPTPSTFQQSSISLF